MKKNNTLLISIIGCLFLFGIISFLYFTPVLSGKYLSQSDIINYKGGAQELEQYRKINGKDTYWTDSMFGGMPTYQMGAVYPSDIVKIIDKGLNLFPRPANYLFLLLGGFFLLGMVWLKNWKYALLGSVMFAFSTYFFIILSAGHNSKVHTIAYFAPFVAGIYLLYQRKYVWGFILTTLFLSLQIGANHPQMTYYLFLALGIYGIIELISAIKQKEIKPFLVSTGLFVLAIFLSVGLNASRLLSTYEYSKETTRGKSELTINNDNSKSGLDHEYITAWSYGKLETLNLFIPNFMGGGSKEKSFNFSTIYNNSSNYITSPEDYNRFEISFSGSYWGEQPGTSGPAYQGAIVIFLGILALFYYKGKYKWWLLAATILSFILAWGKNINFITSFLIDYFPLYNKFRAVSSALVVAEFTIPLLAMLGVYGFFKDSSLTNEYKKKVLIITSGIIGTILVILYLFGLYILDFHNVKEGENISSGFLEIIRNERFELFRKDVARTLFFTVIAFGILFLSVLNKITPIIAIMLIALFSTIDLWVINKRYLNVNNFVDKKFYDNPFPTKLNENLIYEAKNNPALINILSAAPMNNILNLIKENDKTHYRVFNTAYNSFNETNTSYFHNSIGGYHGAKLRRYQDIIDVYFSRINDGTFNVLDMLNTKYILQSTQNDSIPYSANINENNNGNAWFVREVIEAKNADEEISKLASIDNKTQAILISADKSELNLTQTKDEFSIIKLEDYKPNEITYKSQSNVEQLGVFSEIFYPYGWKAYIDGVESKIYRANYILRALKIPSGTHTIKFTFEPSIINKGKNITIVCFILFLIFSGGLIFWTYKQNKSIS